MADRLPNDVDKAVDKMVKRTEVIEDLPPITPQDLLARDLQHDPPDGFPKLPAMSAAYVLRRAQAPAESKEASLRAIGASNRSPIPRASKVRAYLRALALGSMPLDVDPVVLRRETISRLGRVVRGGEDRDAVMAAKVLDSYLPPRRDEGPEDLTAMSDEDLAERLADTLAALRDQMGEDSIQVSAGSART